MATRSETKASRMNFSSTATMDFVFGLSPTVFSSAFTLVVSLNLVACAGLLVITPSLMIERLAHLLLNDVSLDAVPSFPKACVKIVVRRKKGKNWGYRPTRKRFTAIPIIWEE